MTHTILLVWANWPMPIFSVHVTKIFATLNYDMLNKYASSWFGVCSRSLMRVSRSWFSTDIFLRSFPPVLQMMSCRPKATRTGNGDSPRNQNIIAASYDHCSIPQWTASTNVVFGRSYLLALNSVWQGLHQHCC